MSDMNLLRIENDAASKYRRPGHNLGRCANKVSYNNAKESHLEDEITAAFGSPVVPEV